MTFDRKIVVITGAAQGIGAAAMELFLEKGACVVCLDIAPAKEGDAENCLYVECDVSKADQVERAFRQVLDQFGRIDVLVNNAAVQTYGTVEETSEEEWDRVLAVNVKGAFLCAKQALPSMTAQRNGVIVNVSSVQALMSEEHVVAYATSKAAMLGLTRSIAVDYAQYNVRSSAVCPGSVGTPLLQWAADQSGDPEAMMDEIRGMHLLNRVADPSEIAHMIAYLASDEASFITGQAFRIDGGLGVKIGGAFRGKQKR